ncbi:putative lipid II flippase FtsW [Homoserinibacter sp. GY 40078]|uniref:putative lipid II flippase FtsW n=1 Tax=Homoserinibacter sp. GY 40078 TaxID=2603275 RepID=UPI0011C7F157|nr:putative lipid II flippase FtsW [Homoserinibacter sp. GY 40078]TXK17688.1 putative lipid II flippase FtsW [Homoserinibacter sp. GY 40078]
MTTTRPSRPNPPPDPDPSATADETRRGPAARVVVRRIFAAETPEYFLLLGTTLFLVVFGLVMVLSSSSIESWVSDGDFFARASRQAILALIGVPLMLIAARAPRSFWRRWAWHLIIGALVLQAVVVVVGAGQSLYNNNWLYIGGFSLQPSELIKLGFVVWLALVVTRVAPIINDWRRADWREYALPLAPAVAGIMLVMLGNDLGTTVILAAMVLGSLYFGGVRLSIVSLITIVGSLGAAIAVQASDSRSERFAVWFEGCTDIASRYCYQTLQGWQALGDGGIFGVGLGNSTAKWSWLPEAETDFIFAVIGEELGLIGALLVVALFVVLAICFVRIIRRQVDPYAKLATAIAMIWIIGQAFVNIAVVLGLLPVLGVPLPFISAGGSSLVTTLLAVGIVLSFARHDPRAREQLR